MGPRDHVGDPDDRGEMENDVDVITDVVQRVGIGEVAAEQRDPRRRH